MASPRLVAFLEALDAAMPRQLERAEALILRVPGEGQPALAADAEARVLQGIGDGLAGPVQAWVQAVRALADVERGWGPRDRAREAGLAFNRATGEFLDLWERLLLVQPATPPMRHVVGLVHQGCYEFFLSGPRDLWRGCRGIVEGKAEARIAFEPSAPSLTQATHELRALRRP